MATRHVATVFGGSGFIGRYVVKRLAQRGYVVRVAVRDPEAALFLKPMGAVGQVVPLYASVMNEPTVHRAIAGADVVINLVGALTESPKATFQAVHADAAERISRIAAATGVGRLIQMSAIGADPDSPSRYGSSKGKAEQAVRAAFPTATILRPSLVFGLEDKFFNRFAELARLLPFMPVISGGTKMQPVYVCDVADAVMAALEAPATQVSGARDSGAQDSGAQASGAQDLGAQDLGALGKVFELGGPRVWTFREILAFILKQTRRDRRLVDIPMGIARLQAAVLQHVPGKPLTPDQLLMLSKDNVVAPGAATLQDLGITPTPVELIVPAYITRYQPGGGRRPTEPLPG